MMYYLGPNIQKHFDANLNDWLAGGPLPTGWTRTGPRLPPLQLKLTGHRLRQIPVDESLAKNRPQTERWHLRFLADHGDVEKTPYFLEYLLPRYGGGSARRAVQFLEVFEDIRRNGVRRPIWVADVGHLGFGFRYFRFEGCHRTCSVKVLGATTIPAYVFTVKGCH